MKSKKETTYTLELTKEELAIIAVALGSISNQKVEDKLKQYAMTTTIDTFDLWKSLDDLILQ